MSSSVERITVGQARKVVQDFSPAACRITQTSDGWLVHVGPAMLVGVNSRRPRVFKSLDRAVRRLAEEVGVTEFTVAAKGAAQT
jgi:hypothetical protein